LIGKKSKTTQDDWLPFLNKSYNFPDKSRAQELVERAITVCEKIIKPGDRIGWGWSGGKDSQGLRVVMEAMQIDDCYLGISSLEYPDFLSWATNRMPERLMIMLNANINLDYLVKHPKMLFPDARNAERWFSRVQRRARVEYIKAENKSLIFLGRRKADQNNNPDYLNAGARVVSPIFDWTHEDLLTVLGAYEVPLPPCYWWPRGFQVGTGSWAARQWTGSIQNGWAEVHSIDPNIVEIAATKIESAMIFLDQKPHGI